MSVSPSALFFSSSEMVFKVLSLLPVFVILS